MAWKGSVVAQDGFDETVVKMKFTAHKYCYPHFLLAGRCLFARMRNREIQLMSLHGKPCGDLIGRDILISALVFCEGVSNNLACFVAGPKQLGQHI